MSHPVELTFAVCLLVLGASYLLRSERWVAFLQDAIRLPHRLFPLALGMLAVGVFIGASYNDWSSTWPIFISAFSWLMAAEGALILVFPQYLKKLEGIPEGFLRWYLRLGGLLLLILGGLLLRSYL
jgi:hypothetical protein